MRRLKDIYFYLVFISLIVIFIIGIIIIWNKFMLGEEIFITISTGIYPLSLLYEIHYDRVLERREKRDIEKGRLFTILNDGDVNVLNRNYSTYSLVIMLLVNGAVVMFRLIFPEKISLESTTISLILFLTSIIIMRKLDKQDHIQ